MSTQKKTIAPVLAAEMTELQARMKKHGFVPAAFARKAGIDPTVWSKILAGKYPATKSLPEKLAAARETAKMVESAGAAKRSERKPQEMPFIETSAWHTLCSYVDSKFAASQEHGEDVLVFLVGDSGHGKDRLMNRLIETRGGVKIQAKPAWRTSYNAALHDIADALMLAPGKNAASTQNAILAALTETPRIICFTEIGPLSVNPMLCELWKCLANETHSVVVIAATPHCLEVLQSQLNHKGGKGDVWKQIARRSAVVQLNEVTAEQAAKALELVNLQDRGSELASAAQESGYGFHFIQAVVRAIKGGAQFDSAVKAYRLARSLLN